MNPTPPNPFDLFLLAGEASGDARGAELLEKLFALRPNLKVAAVAGPKMRRFPIFCVERMERLQVMGFKDVFLSLPRLALFFFSLRKKILALDPNVFVGIDYPGLNLKLYRSLKRKGFRGSLIHYISPTVWAWKRGRIKTMEETLDRLLTILPFEKECFASTTLAVKYVGHPLVETLTAFKANPCWRAQHQLAPKDKILALFPGSRKQEIERNLPLMFRVARRLRELDPALKIGVSIAHPEKEAFIRSQRMPGCFYFTEADTYDLMHQAHLALAKSGTVTLELALHRTPTVVQYAIGSLDLFIAKRIIKLNLPYYSLPNLILQREVFPELFGPRLTEEMLWFQARTLWFDLPARERMQRGCDEVKMHLGEGSASAAAVAEILPFIKKLTFST
jgi:lipid-A-disaccharide synthase